MKPRIKSNPVEIALARESLRQTVQRAQIQALLMDDDEDCRLLLCDYAMIIGTACEAGAMLYGREPWVRQLHGALRTIISLCTYGYKWQSEYALAMQHAMQVANERLFNMPNKELSDAFLSARVLAQQIAEGRIQGDEVLA